MASDLRFLLPPLDFFPFLAAGFLGSGLSRSGIVAPGGLGVLLESRRLALLQLGERRRFFAVGPLARGRGSAATRPRPRPVLRPPQQQPVWIINQREAATTVSKGS